MAPAAPSPPRPLDLPNMAPGPAHLRARRRRRSVRGGRHFARRRCGRTGPRFRERREEAAGGGERGGTGLGAAGQGRPGRAGDADPRASPQGPASRGGRVGGRGLCGACEEPPGDGGARGPEALWGLCEAFLGKESLCWASAGCRRVTEVRWALRGPRWGLRGRRYRRYRAAGSLLGYGRAGGCR